MLTFIKTLTLVVKVTTIFAIFGQKYRSPTPVKIGGSKPSSNFTGNETAANLNSTNAKAVTIKAKWAATVTNFDYTGGQQTFTAPATGYYKLETWGAQGGTYDVSARGGYGAYSVGVINASLNELLYVVVGGKGGNLWAYNGDSQTGKTVSGGYNGGGRATTCTGSRENNQDSAGGGATHIAKVPGLLQDLESYKGTLVNNSYYNSDKILIVSGAGGGGWYWISSANAKGIGGNGGGIEGGSINSMDSRITMTQKATQTTYGIVRYNAGSTVITPTGAFGRAGTETDICSGGGAGWYGGAGYEYTTGGSGYIGSSNLISGGGITKHMTCYSCTTSTAAATRTNSNTNVSATATADYSKTGNGYARITYLGTSI